MWLTVTTKQLQVNSILIRESKERWNANLWVHTFSLFYTDLFLMSIDVNMCTRVRVLCVCQRTCIVQELFLKTLGNRPCEGLLGSQIVCISVHALRIRLDKHCHAVTHECLWRKFVTKWQPLHGLYWRSWVLTCTLPLAAYVSSCNFAHSLSSSVPLSIVLRLVYRAYIFVLQN